MTQPKFRFLPEANIAAPQPADPPPVKGDSPCPCCGCITIPNGGDAPAYICPVCFWEIDPFTGDENEPSDQNHSLTLLQARQNYAQCGAVLPRLKQHCRSPFPEENPAGNAINQPKNDTII